ncbi:MAG: hypothetical protein NBKEAIPA_03388 [Nitrospirae bacterium]|nr:hypothetical protein [Nitrospirota bacterium]MCE7965624.1 hypothetical protein [Nitrospira sp. NTP2]MCK6492163.1 AEC family transporter [Nitrospira sp.]MEB2339405.1 AEC family transporter [Nitrospirales bacterium]QOJ36045.1 MAG: AEC family transporter [Nitrospira sp.]
MPVPLQAFLLIFVAGAALRSTGVLGKPHAERLAWFVFSFSLPATILISLDRTAFAPTAWKLPLAACLVTLPMLLSAWWLSRLLRLPRATQGGFLIATGCINSVYFAYPVALATFGEQGLAQAILFDLGQTTLTLTVIYGLAVWYGAAGGSMKPALRRFLSSPPLWALAVSLLLSLLGWHLPAWLLQALTPLHLTTTPLASLVLGLAISFSALQRTLSLALVGVAWRMGGGFLLGLGAAWLLSLSGIERAIVLLVAAMPSAITAVIFATDTSLDEDLVTSIVALSICLGVILLPWLPHLAQFLER